jgi:hypothetical protein
MSPQPPLAAAHRELHFEQTHSYTQSRKDERLPYWLSPQAERSEQFSAKSSKELEVVALDDFLSARPMCGVGRVPSGDQSRPENLEIS